MGEGTKIEWCDHTFNPWWGCQRVSPGCQHCYAETLAKRYGHDVWGPTNHSPRRFFGDQHWAEPLAWNRKAGQAGRRARVFCSSMADVFESYRILDGQRSRLWGLIEATPWLDWLLLTKRPENVLCHPDGPMVPNDWLSGFPPNIWVGASAENQEWYDRRRLWLRGIPARVRFWSMEPLIGPIVIDGHDPVQWLIVGGESGPHARPMRPDWARSLRDQACAMGKHFFFKQWGEELPKGQGDHGLDERGLFRRESHVGGQTYYRVGKARAGRLLDGRTWDEVPA